MSNQAVAIPILVLTITAASMGFSACSEEETLNPTGNASRFDQTTWKTLHGSQDPDNARARMLRDLRANHLKIGMARAEVEALLGEADKTRNGHYLYRLGMGKYSVDYSYLGFVYDDEGKLAAILDTRS